MQMRKQSQNVQPEDLDLIPSNKELQYTDDDVQRSFIGKDYETKGSYYPQSITPLIQKSPFNNKSPLFNNKSPYLLKSQMNSPMLQMDHYSQQRFMQNSPMLQKQPPYFQDNDNFLTPQNQQHNHVFDDEGDLNLMFNENENQNNYDQHHSNFFNNTQQSDNGNNKTQNFLFQQSPINIKQQLPLNVNPTPLNSKQPFENKIDNDIEVPDFNIYNENQNNNNNQQKKDSLFKQQNKNKNQKKTLFQSNQSKKINNKSPEFQSISEQMQAQEEFQSLKVNKKHELFKKKIKLNNDDQIEDKNNININIINHNNNKKLNNSKKNTQNEQQSEDSFENSTQNEQDNDEEQNQQNNNTEDEEEEEQNSSFQNQGHINNKKNNKYNKKSLNKQKQQQQFQHQQEQIYYQQKYHQQQHYYHPDQHQQYYHHDQYYGGMYPHPHPQYMHQNQHMNSHPPQHHHPYMHQQQPSKQFEELQSSPVIPTPAQSQIHNNNHRNQTPSIYTPKQSINKHQKPSQNNNFPEPRSNNITPSTMQIQNTTQIYGQQSSNFSTPYKDREDEGGNNSRSERGLRSLSLKVKDIVCDCESGSTTYKEVADKLIQEIEQQRKNNPEEEGANNQSKEEQNVKRRVYDALNVLIAADVLKKDGKQVKSFSKDIKKGKQQKIHPQKRKAMLEDKIKQYKQLLETKEKKVKDLLHKYLGIQILQERNRQLEEEDQQYEEEDEDMSELNESIRDVKEEYQSPQIKIEETNSNKQSVNKKLSSNKNSLFKNPTPKSKPPSANIKDFLINNTPSKKSIVNGQLQEQEEPILDKLKFPLIAVSSQMQQEGEEKEIKLVTSKDFKKLKLQSKRKLVLYGDLDLVMLMGFHKKKQPKIIKLLEETGLMNYIDYEWEE